MTTELILLLTIFAFLMMGIFLGQNGPIGTFKRGAPRLAARVERNLTIGNGFRQSADNQGVNWVAPLNGQ